MTGSSNPAIEGWPESVLFREGLPVMLLDLRFRRLVVCVGAVETHASDGPGIVNVGAQHVPAFAQMQYAVVPLGRPALRSDSNPFLLGHLRYWPGQAGQAVALCATFFCWRIRMELPNGSRRAMSVP